MQVILPADPTVCPLCGQSNQCAGQVARTTGVQQPPCWCNQVMFGAELLARVPEHARRMACVCAACAQSGGA
ncbi:cysteine-rich CWC family protein [Rhodoferax sp. UBA5149]|uniref:cysteine-rich CWC family protein n=1 Tax=Rhodoferax sp. UBA5149 TaxID=1947379 RepID=UPI0025D560CD|nr:cysteine-rich CWC family protein [Rhodoferax sp. UBA5149]